MPDTRSSVAAAPMTYTEWPAAPELRPWVAAHWHFRVAEDVGEIEHRVPLTGGVMIHVARRLPDTPILTGPRAAPLVVPVRGGDEFWGTHLWPGAAGALLGVAAGDLRDALGPAEAFVGQAWARRLARRLQEAWSQEAQNQEAPNPPSFAATSPATGEELRATTVLDAAWQELGADAGALDEAVLRAVFLLLRSGGEDKVGRLAAAAGLSSRQFRRRFRAAVGLSAKELARLIRVRASAAGLVASESRWVDLAAEHGYADQAHLVREYRTLLGVTPARFRRHLDHIEHRRLLF